MLSKLKHRITLKELAPKLKKPDGGAWINRLWLDDYQYAITRDAQGRVKAIFQRGLKVSGAEP